MTLKFIGIVFVIWVANCLLVRYVWNSITGKSDTTGRVVLYVTLGSSLFAVEALYLFWSQVN